MSIIWTKAQGPIEGPYTIPLDGGMVVVGVPDWVRLPPQLGGHQVRVIGAGQGPCPSCGAPVAHLDLEGNLGVAHCECAGYQWYRTKESGGGAPSPTG